MAKEFSRARRVEEQIKRELAVMINREVDAPGLGLVTFTAVDMAPDLSTAKVYFTLLGSDYDQRQGEKILGEAAPHLRHCLAQVLSLRCVPVLRFFYDVSIERGAKMESLLDQVVEQDSQSNNDLDQDHPSLSENPNNAKDS